ncbi:c-type cytochrome [Polaromonas naphthalenivorans]|uniref:Cytochrome c, class I n=1 Tax=Polaromonas naphthalenivorans (strain CJ2) TaxID=365044 RepID=A1VP25_POLNA|nr:cytochrome c [Polaromonas naphthalenivorans]ABM37403.1 cytochrome c, class I [Polaromonas naphthalenivorans CJ2]
MKKMLKLALSMGLLAVGAAAVVWSLNVRDEVDVNAPVAFVTSDSVIARGKYLTVAGNCMTCHTARGGQNYAGGLGIATPFGTVFTSNLTPDATTGIGSWTASHFWRALHNGRSKDGRLLYPAFPYTSYTQVTREDSDAMFAYLRSQPAVNQPNQPNTLRFPYQSQAALAVWRTLYFKPGVYQPDARRDAEWNRGAYLTSGLGHCSACHSPRDALGGTRNSLALAGGLIPMQNWYAPSLTSPHEAGVSHWDREQIVGLLKNGVAPGTSASGPMAEVVLRSTQHLTNQDLGAMASYLKALPGASAPPEKTAPPGPARPSLGTNKTAKLYEQHCAQCHGTQGEGIANAYPPLASNRAVTMTSTTNLVQMVLGGGYPPATAGNPKPFGMPPFVLVLSDSEIADVITHIRTSWGNQAGAVTPQEVNRIRANQGH